MELLCCFGSQRGSAGEDTSDGGEVVFGACRLVFGHLDDDGWDEVESFDLVGLNRVQVACEFKLRQDDDAVAAVGAALSDDDEAIDMREGEEAEADFGAIAGAEFALRGFHGANLKDIGDYIAVGDHYSFLVGVSILALLMFSLLSMCTYRQTRSTT